MRIFLERYFARTPSKPLRKNCNAFLKNEGKIHGAGYVGEFFCKLPGWHLATSLRINLFTYDFQGSKIMNAFEWLLLVLV